MLLNEPAPRGVNDDPGPGKALFFANIVLIIFAGLFAFKCAQNLLDSTFRSNRFYSYYLPAVLAALLLLSLKLRPRIKLNCVIVILSSAVGLLLANLCLLLPHPAPATFARRAGRQFDGRTQFEVVLDLRREGIDACPMLGAPVLLAQDVRRNSPIRIDGAETLPLGGISRRPTVQFNESGLWPVYDADEHGFHNPRGIWTAAKIDIGIVGDSFTHGCCVLSDRNWVSKIREHHPLTLNLGMGGNGPLLELAALREYLPALKPGIVLWAYCPNDLRDLRSVEKHSSLLLRYLENDSIQGLISRQEKIDASLMDFVAKHEPGARRWPPRLQAIGLSRRSLPLWVQDVVVGTEYTEASKLVRSLRLEDVRGLLSSAFVPDINAPGETDLELFAKILARAAATTASWNGKLFFVYLPSSDLAGSPDELRLRESVLRIVESLGLPIIDLYPPMKSHRDRASLFYYPGSHYSEAGHRVAGLAVLDFLSQAGVHGS